MIKNVLVSAALVFGLSVSAAQAQDTPNVQAPSVSQTGAGATPSPETSGYGGTGAQSGAGAIARNPGSQPAACVGPAFFCDIFKGGE